ncbi:TetR/AcrR family transcriptional regulator [Mucilaginibacter psychrotolerans]|uniref:TetR/AcrR family transcriptional regulator n=1 Tax=Mucilaginibacter psychrotolerans TaxID=1524096 RepID=A0A4Y8SQT3_9SPHI|nr:TetR/AcrR family transcriptional regulator [Mucilaginibacter psychrotolerans]TFF40736.1 TetR/AcrR family transcriptional regulator [Mucilaginibacter psychrotolerans]
MARTKDFDESEVLKKAVDIFWLKGYNATSMQDLVDGLGISRSSLYDTYGDKHTLFIKALAAYQCTNSGMFVDIINADESTKNIIRNLLSFVVDNLLNDKFHKGCFMVNAEVEVALHDKEVSDMIQKNDQQLEETFYLVIKKGQENGEIGSRQDARAIARFMFNTIKGIQVIAKSTCDRAVFEDIINTAVMVLG